MKRHSRVCAVCAPFVGYSAGKKLIILRSDSFLSVCVGNRRPCLCLQLVYANVVVVARASGNKCSSEVSQLDTWTIHPKSRVYCAWWIAFTAFSVFAVLFTTTVIAFFDTDLIAIFAGEDLPRTGLSVAIIEIIIDVVWAIDSALTFCVAYYKDGVLVTSHRAIALHYAVFGSMDSGSFFLDLLATIPIDTIVLACVSNPSENLAEYISLFRLFRVFKLNKVVILFEVVQLRFNRLLVFITIIRLLSTVLLIAHTAGCIFYFLARVQNFSGDTWISAGSDECDGDIIDAGAGSIFQRYVVSLYWSVTTLTTVGYGDFTPGMYSVQEQVFVIIYIIFNVLLLSYVSGSFTMMVIRKDKEISEYRDKQLATLEFVRRHKLPRPVLITMQTYLRQQLASGGDVTGSASFSRLPPTLSSRVRTLLYQDVLTAVPLLESTSSSFRSKLSSKMTVINMSANVELLSSGQAVTRFLILIEGAVLGFRTGRSDDADTIADDASGGDTQRYEKTLVTAPAVLGFPAFAAARRTATSAVTIRQSVIGVLEKTDYDDIVAEEPADGVIVLNNAIQPRSDGPMGLEALSSSLVKVRSELCTTAIERLRWSCARGDISQLDTFARAGLLDGACDEEDHENDDASTTTSANENTHRADMHHPRSNSRRGGRGGKAMSPLLVASYHGHVNVVSELLALGANPTPCVSRHEYLPLFGAIVGGHSEIINSLLEAGASLSNATAPWATSMEMMLRLHRFLLDSIIRGDIAVLELLLQCGMDPDGGKYSVPRAMMLVPPLHVACRMNDKRAVAALLKYGATETRVWNGKTARDIAVEAGSGECLDPLLWNFEVDDT